MLFYCLNTNIYSNLETSGGKSSNLYLNIVHFFITSVNYTSVAAYDNCFPALVSNSCCSIWHNIKCVLPFLLAPATLSKVLTKCCTRRNDKLTKWLAPKSSCLCCHAEDLFRSFWILLTFCRWMRKSSACGWALCLSVESSLANRHLAKRHLANRHLTKRHLANRHLG